MATTVHLPKTLLDALDRRARALHVSRNRLIVEAVERALANQGDWSAGFFESLEPMAREDARAVDEMLGAIISARTPGKSSAL